MRDLIRFLPDNAILDLAAPDYGHPNGTRIISALHGKMTRNIELLVCEKHGSPVYLQRRPVSAGSSTHRMWAIHFDSGDRCASEPARMSDEHKRQTDYVVRAADDAGYRTATEVRLPGGTTRPDAVIYGPAASVAVEVQRSALTRQAAVSRTARTIKAGIGTVTWFNDRETIPRWFFRVPSVGMNLMLWDRLPPRRAATVTTGVRVITAARCNFGQCPVTRRQHCGGFHPRHEPWLGLTVDDVAGMAPAGKLIPVQFGRDVLLVSPESAARYEDVTGHAAGLALNPAAETRIANQARRVECSRPETTAAPLDWRGQQHWLGRTDQCRYCGQPAILRDAEGRPAHKVCAEGAS